MARERSARTCCENLLCGISTSLKESLSKLVPIWLAEMGETAAWSAAKEVDATRPPEGEESSGSTVTSPVAKLANFMAAQAQFHGAASSR